MINRDNYKAYKRYLSYLSDMKQLDRLTVDKYRKELVYLLEWADEQPLFRVHTIRPSFPKFLLEADGNGDGKPLTSAYARRVSAATRAFLTWLRMSEGGPYRDLSESWLETLTAQRQRQGAIREHEFYTVEEVRQLLSVPADSLLTRRDQAAVAFLFISGARIGAFVTMTTRCVDVEHRRVRQWPDLGVVTKNRKAATTYFLDVPDLLEVVGQWDALVRSRSSENDLWYPILSRWRQDCRRETGDSRSRDGLLPRTEASMLGGRGHLQVSAQTAPWPHDAHASRCRNDQRPESDQPKPDAQQPDDHGSGLWSPRGE